MFPCLKIFRQFQWAYRCLPVAEFVTIIFIRFWFLTRWFNKFNKSTALNFVKAKHFARFIRCHKLYQCSRSFITPHLDFSGKTLNSSHLPTSIFTRHGSLWDLIDSEIEDTIESITFLRVDMRYTVTAESNTISKNPSRSIFVYGRKVD